MNSNVPIILALAYYDGATEGYFNRSEDDRIYFFKTVAWDASQDQRLFLLCQVRDSDYLELLEILSNTQKNPNLPVWIPDWTFNNAKSQERANKIIETSKDELKNSRLLMLGESLTGECQVLNKTEKGLLKAISWAQADVMGDLETWLAEEA